MRLTDWAKKIGIKYKSAWNLYSQGKIPGAYKLISGSIIVPEEKPKKKRYTVTYARVSSSENKDNLKQQSLRLQSFCSAKGWIVHKNITEIGSGLNDNRKKLADLLEEGKITRLVVEHKDRLARFGVRYIEILCKHIGCKLIIINQTHSGKEDLISDFISVITSFCARIYGLRRKTRKTEALIQELNSEKEKISKI